MNTNFRNMSVQQYSNSSGGGGGGGFEATAEWAITLSDGKHRIQFEHGTTSGKRVIVLDGKVSKKRAHFRHKAWAKFAFSFHSYIGNSICDRII